MWSNYNTCGECVHFSYLNMCCVCSNRDVSERILVKPTSSSCSDFKDASGKKEIKKEDDEDEFSMKVNSWWSGFYLVVNRDNSLVANEIVESTVLIPLYWYT